MPDVYRKRVWVSKDGKTLEGFGWDSSVDETRIQDGVHYTLASNSSLRGNQSPYVHAEWTEPIVSNACGVAPDQVAEARSVARVAEYADDGSMIFRSHEHRKASLREIGFVDKN